MEKINSIKKWIIPLVWSLILAAGFIGLVQYSAGAGVAAQKTDWPKGSVLTLDAKLPTFVMFLHPQCSCSVASVNELVKMLPEIDGKSKVVVAFFKPESETDAWAKSTTLWKTLAKTNVQLLIDEEGVEADRFGSETSGQTFLFEPNGESIFQGGITAARGHEGGSRGQEIVVDYINNKETLKYKISSVFGCSIKNPERKIK